MGNFLEMRLRVGGRSLCIWMREGIIEIPLGLVYIILTNSPGVSPGLVQSLLRDPKMSLT